MEKGIDIHNYDKLLVSTLKRMKASNISEKNKKIIEKFGEDTYTVDSTKLSFNAHR